MEKLLFGKGDKIMYKRLTEVFIDNYSYEDCEILKEYANGKLIFAEIFNVKSDKTVIFYDKTRFFSENCVDTENECYLDMNIFEDKLSEDGGVEDMTSLVNYYLSEEFYNCLCIKYDGYIELERVNYDLSDCYEPIVKYISDFLVEIDVCQKENSDKLARAIEESLFNGNHISICGFELYYDDISKKDYEEAEEC